MTGSDPRDFDVTLPELLGLVNRMTATNKVIEETMTEVRGVVEKLHASWTGVAADAHTEWHANWSNSLADLRDGLNDVRDSCQTAHRNYTAAVEANLTMWDI